MNWEELAGAIEAGAGVRIDPASAVAVGGGSINAAYRVESRHGPVFIKCNDGRCLPMLSGEARGLAELRASNSVSVPEVIGLGCAGDVAYLVLQWLDLGAGGAAAARQLGQELAAMHGCEGGAFGFDEDNFIGSTPQVNTPCDDWPTFFARHRIGYQLDLAGDVALRETGAQLLPRIPGWFDGVDLRPVLLHGDLWGGNWGTASGQPYLFDPAVYYGDPESDIAMTELFGGFGSAFYAAYRERRPERRGDATRRKLYKLYHVLNHYNLFGGGYARQARMLMETLLEA